jgi:hypothetical protein
MEMIVMGKYDLIEGRDREAFVRTCGLFLRVPMNVFSMDKDCNWGGGGDYLPSRCDVLVIIVYHHQQYDLNLLSGTEL